MEGSKQETIYKIERKKKALESMWNATQYKGHDEINRDYNLFVHIFLNMPSF